MYNIPDQKKHYAVKRGPQNDSWNYHENSPT